MNIWYGTKENAHLSNLYARPFSDKEGRKYVSVEHAYQTWKSGSFDSATYERRWRCGSKFIGKRAKTIDNWNIGLMRRLIFRSFDQNPTAASALVSTETEPFTHTQDRGVWRTLFPLILTEVRTELSTKRMAPHSSSPVVCLCPFTEVNFHEHIDTNQ